MAQLQEGKSTATGQSINQLNTTSNTMIKLWCELFTWHIKIIDFTSYLSDIYQAEIFQNS